MRPVVSRKKERTGRTDSVSELLALHRTVQRKIREMERIGRGHLVEGLLRVEQSESGRFFSVPPDVGRLREILTALDLLSSQADDEEISREIRSLIPAEVPAASLSWGPLRAPDPEEDG